jgi:hypothetical protein
MKFSEKKNNIAALYIAIRKQALLFFLLIAFINTIVFPYIAFIASPSSFKNKVSAESEMCSSLAEYIMEDCLDVVDTTPDSQEEDINDIEKLFDEVDFIHQLNSSLSFRTGIHEIKKYMQDRYPLMLSCYHSPTPPPEC